VFAGVSLAAGRTPGGGIVARPAARPPGAWGKTARVERPRLAPIRPPITSFGSGACRGGPEMGVAHPKIFDFCWEDGGLRRRRGGEGKPYSPADVRGPRGTLVAFICNHCPYVRAVIGRLVEEAAALREIGIGTIAVMPNDTESYPDDSFDNMKVFARRHGFAFP